MKQSVPLWLFVVGLLAILLGSGCGGGGGSSSTGTDGGTPATDLRLGATLTGGTFIDPTSIAVGEVLQMKIFGLRDGAIVEVPATSWTTNAPASVATLTSSGILTGVGASATNYTISAVAQGTTVTTTLNVRVDGGRVTGRVIVPGLSGAPLAGVTIQFFNNADALVGIAKTGHNGTFRGVVPAAATRFSLQIAASSAYFRQFSVGEDSFLSEEPTCRAPLPAHTAGATVALPDNIELFLRSAGPPPPPTGCLG